MGAIRYRSDFYSLNGTPYRLEIWDKEYSGTAHDFNTNQNSVVVNFNTNGDKKLNEIITSTLEFEFIVEDSSQQAFINYLRSSTIEEKDVYVCLKNGTTSVYKDQFTGILLLDLSDAVDEHYPYTVKMKAIDGIALLKEIDFVPNASTNTAPYSITDTYIHNPNTPTGNRYAHYIGWILEALNYADFADFSTQGWTTWQIATCVNWYNEHHANITDDPLRVTSCNGEQFYKQEGQSDNGVQYYKPVSCYKALQMICRAWGMRMVMYQQRIYFIQVGLYKTPESGNTASPENIRTKIYHNTGSLQGTFDYLGDNSIARYEQILENGLATDGGLKKLATASWGEYPVVKKVSTNFPSISNYNAFQSFPLLYGTNAVPHTWPTFNGDTFGEVTTSLGTINDAANLDGFYMMISLQYHNSFLNPVQSILSFTVRAKPSSSATWNSTTGLVACWSSDGSGNYQINWEPLRTIASNNAAYPSFRYNNSNTSTLGGSVDDLMFSQVLTIAPGTSLVDIIANTQVGANGNVLPTHSSMTGDWDFEFYTVAMPGDSSINQGGIDWNGAVKKMPGTSPFWAPPWVNHNGNLTNYPNWGAPGNVYYQNVAPTLNLCMFSPVQGGSIGAASYNTQYFTNTTDSYILDIDDTMWGDTNTQDVPGSLKVWNGNNWVFTNYLGRWGVNTTSGTDSFTEVLCQEALNIQSLPTQKGNYQIALSETNKNIDGSALYPKYVNPLGLLKDTTNNHYYMMMRMKQNIGMDENSGMWSEFVYNTKTGTVVTHPNDDGGGAVDLGAAGFASGNGTVSMVNQTVNTRNSSYAQASWIPVVTVNDFKARGSAFTTLTVEEAGITTNGIALKSGDKLVINQAGKEKNITLTADFVTSGESLSTQLQFSSVTCDWNIDQRAEIYVNTEDLYNEAINKTRGSVAGFVVDADGLTKDGVEITTFSNNTTIPNNANTLSTSAAVKSYVDTQVASVPKGLTYQGTWNAESNSPTIESGTGTVGNYYIVATAGTTTIDGISDWKVGDWIIFTDHTTDHWQKIDQSEGDTLQSVTSRGDTTTIPITINPGSAGGSITWKESDGATAAGKLMSQNDRGELFLYKDGVKKTEITSDTDSFIPKLHIGGTSGASQTLDVTGNIAVTGTVDGVDIATRDTALTSAITDIGDNTTNISTNTTNITNNTTNISSNSTAIATKAPIASPTFTGTVGGIDKTMVGLSNVDNTSDANKPISTATQTALDAKATTTALATTNTNVTTNATNIASNDTDIGTNATSILSNTSSINTNTSNISTNTSHISTNTTNIGTKAPINDPTFTGTVAIPNITDLETAVTTNTAKVSFNSTASTKVGHLTVTATTDLDTMRSDVTANNAKVTFPGLGTTSTTALAGDTTTITTDQANAITANTAKTGITATEQTKLGYISVTDSVNLNTMNGAITGNTNALANKVNITTNQTVGGNKTFTGTINLDDGSSHSPTLNFFDEGDIKFTIQSRESNELRITRDGNGGVDFQLEANASDHTNSYLKIGGSRVITNDNASTYLDKTDVGLDNVDNTSDANKPVSTAQQTAIDLKANIASPTFTGTVGGITATMVGLGNVDNTSDANKPVSTATQTALDAKAPIASPEFTTSAQITGNTGDIGLKLYHSSTEDTWKWQQNSGGNFELRYADSEEGAGVALMILNKSNGNVSFPSSDGFSGADINGVDIVALNTKATTNETDIATNTTAISNKADTSALNTTNTNVSNNAASISTNAGNISTNEDDISDNAGNISTNTSNISTNTTNISTNTTAIAGKQTTVTLTTEGTSGAATFNSGTGALNIPQYSGSTFAGLKSISCGADATQTISSGGNVGSKTSYTTINLTNALGGTTLTAPFSLSSGKLRISQNGTYMINFSLCTTVSATANRLLAGGMLFKQLQGDEEEYSLTGTQLFNYDRGTETGSGGASWGSIMKGSGGGSCILVVDNIAGAATYMEVWLGMWIEGRSTSASGVTSDKDGTILNVVQIKGD